MVLSSVFPVQASNSHGASRKKFKVGRYIPYGLAIVKANTLIKLVLIVCLVKECDACGWRCWDAAAANKTVMCCVVVVCIISSTVVDSSVIVDLV